MINSTSNTDSVLRTPTIAGKPSQITKTVPNQPDTDRLSASNQENLKALLQSQPEIRPEVVANAKKMAINGNYPPAEIIRRLSEMLVRSVDLSEKP